MGTLPPLDEVFIALGTTINQAGSQAAFRAVDHGAVLAFAVSAPLDIFHPVLEGFGFMFSASALTPMLARSLSSK